jgi:5-methylcytosine-specific restriction endonuclease McrA
LKVLCPACDGQLESARQRSSDAQAAGYLCWGNTPEYRRQQRESAARIESRELAPYVPQAERIRRAQMVRAEEQASRIRARWAAEWLRPFRTALYQSDAEFREYKKAKSRAEYWERLDQSRLKTARYKRANRNRAVLHETRRNRRIAEASDGTLTPALISWLKRRTRYCAYCSTTMFPSDKVTDHMVPLCAGGEHSLRNLVICCRLCNGRKASLRYEEWVERVAPEHRQRVVALYEQRYGLALQAIA